MTHQEIQELLELVAKSDLTEVKVKDGDFEILIRTGAYSKTKYTSAPVVAQPAMQVPIAPAAAPVSAATPASAPTASTSNDTDSTEGLLEVRSPIVGTFYRSPSPDKPVYVSVGDTISEGSVVCIVEAMKLFNEIESEVAGRIVKVMVDDASPVEYDQVLFLVDPKG